VKTASLKHSQLVVGVAQADRCFHR